MPNMFAVHLDALGKAPAPVAGLAPYLRIVHDFQPGPSLSIPRRRINDVALLYIKRGTGDLTTDHGKADLRAGQLMMIPPMRPHSFRLTDDIGVHLLNFHFDPVTCADSAMCHWDHAHHARSTPPPGSLGSSTMMS